MAKLLFTTLWGMGVAVCPMLCWGFGFGDIQVDSRLNQPFRARVEIVDVSDEDWRQIQARVAPRASPDEGARPEFLESLTLHPMEDAYHRRFIEVRSTEAFTEPLFDLPIEVAGTGLQMVRSYPVLLDPPSTEGATQEPIVTSGLMPTAPSVSRAIQEAPAPIPVESAHLPVHRRQQTPHDSAHRGPSDTAQSDTARIDRNAATAALQKQLEGQLATLEQMLTEMRQTLLTQDVEIAHLTSKLKAREQTAATRSPPAAARVTASVTNSASAVVTGVQRSTDYWIAALSMLAVLGLILQRLRRSEQAFVTAVTTSMPQEAPAQVQLSVPPEEPSLQSKAPSEAPDDPEVTVPMPVLEDQRGFEDKMGFQTVPADEDTVALQEERSFINKEVAKILEESISQEPDRVDIKIKLLEIYHHEALGNRADFLSLFTKLTSDPRALSSVQWSHVEKLQHTLFEGHLDADIEFVTRVAM